jgi:hypothetical protein
VLGYEFDDWAAADIDIARDNPPVQTVVTRRGRPDEFFHREAPRPSPGTPSEPLTPAQTWRPFQDHKH